MRVLLLRQMPDCSLVIVSQRANFSSVRLRDREKYEALWPQNSATVRSEQSCLSSVHLLGTERQVFRPSGNQFALASYSCASYCVPSLQDVAWLAGQLGDLKESIEVDDHDWNHGAFVYSTRARKLVYDHLATLLPTPSL